MSLAMQILNLLKTKSHFEYTLTSAELGQFFEQFNNVSNPVACLSAHSKHANSELGAKKRKKAATGSDAALPGSGQTGLFL